MRAWGLVVDDGDQVGAPEDLQGQAGSLQVQVEVLVGAGLAWVKSERRRKCSIERTLYFGMVKGQYS